MRTLQPESRSQPTWTAEDVERWLGAAHRLDRRETTVGAGQAPPWLAGRPIDGSALPPPWEWIKKYGPPPGRERRMLILKTWCRGHREALEPRCRELGDGFSVRTVERVAERWCGRIAAALNAAMRE